MPGSKPFDYTSNDQLGWAEESSLDTQWAHAIAPGANIILLAAVSDNDSDLIAAQNFAIQQGLGNIISESFGESEYDLITEGSTGLSIISGYEAGYLKAHRKNISVLVSAGDSGSSDPTTNPDGSPGVPFPVAAYPASSPNVTAVGGTNLFFGSLGAANPNGPYETESVWNDGYGAGGGGISAYFNVPDYQTSSLPSSTLGVLNGSRGYPDIAYNAGVIGGVIVHLGFLGTAADGFYIFGGTSCGAPQWAGLTALMNEIAHHPLGFLNPRLYNVASGLGHDIVAGQNGFNGVQGYIAAPSWDLATGWGTPTAELLYRLSGGY
jgi:subtilase family serine protease